MTTNILVLQLAVILAASMTTTLAGKTFRLRTLALRNRVSQTSQLSTVIERIDQLTMLIGDLQKTVDEIQETVNHINATVDPPVRSRFSFTFY